MTITTTTNSDIELTTTEQDQLTHCEQRIDHLRQAFTEAGAALQTIREQRLYRAQHRTFEAYCQARWGFSRVQAHRLIQAAEVSHNLLPIGNIVMPENEAQARPLTKLDTPEEQQEAWQEAVARSGGKPTARVVGEVVEERTRPRIDRLSDEEHTRLFEKLKRKRLRYMGGGSMSDQGRTYHIVRDVRAYGDMDERYTITYVDEAEALLTLPVPPAPPSRWARVAEQESVADDDQEAAAANLEQVFTPEPPPEKDAHENAMKGAIEPETNVDKLVRYGFPRDLADILDREQWWFVSLSLQPNKFVLERRDLFGAERHDVSIEDMQVLFAPLLTPREEPRSNLDKMLRYGFPHDLAELLDRDHWHLLRQTAEGDRFVFEKHDPFSKDVYTVSIADLQKLFAPVLHPPQREPEPEPEEDMTLPDGWGCRSIDEGGRWYAYTKQAGSETKAHPTEAAAIREALSIQRLRRRAGRLGWVAEYTPQSGWRLYGEFTGNNANGDFEEFLYTLERAG